jgi:hypothetical protein
MARHPNGVLVFVGSLAALFLVAVFFIVSIASGKQPNEVDRKRAAQRHSVREKLDQESHQLLTTEGWSDKAKGIVRVPVKDVYASTITELKAKKLVASQVTVEAPLPMPVADPKSTEPAPSALPSAPQGADTIRFQTLQTPEPAAAEATGTSPVPSPASSSPPTQ